jgi:hypothetical protein
MQKGSGYGSNWPSTRGIHRFGKEEFVRLS